MYYMEILEYRTWIIFYLISFTALLWAVFLSSQGSMLWVSLSLNIIVMGINGGFLVGEIKKYQEKKRMMRELLDSETQEFARIKHPH
jgi:hypothetical protein